MQKYCLVVLCGSPVFNNKKYEDKTGIYAILFWSFL